MSFLSDIFGSGGNPYNKAMPYYNQIPGEEEKYLDPYINEGVDDMGTLHNQYMDLLNNPDALMQHLGQGYQQSPGYQFQVDQATKAANRAAAAGGMAGSGAEQQSLANTVNGLANQDYNQYLDHAMGLYGQGLGGLSHMNDMGYNASQGLSSDIASNLMNEGNLAAEGQQYQDQRDSGLLSQVLSGLFGNSIGSSVGGSTGSPSSNSNESMNNLLQIIMSSM